MTREPNLDTNLQPEELEAILATVAPKRAAPSSVASRDFARPRRLSLERRGELRERIVRALPPLEKELTALLRTPVRISLSDVDEADAQLVLNELRLPLAVAPFQSGGLPCWALWDPSSAVAALELALGAPEAKSGDARKLTSVEGMLFKRLVTTLMQTVGGIVGVGVDGLRVATLLEEVGAPRDAGERFDPRRLAVVFELELATGTSRLRLYLPPPKDEGDAEGALPARTSLPEHLAEVPLTLRARLGGAELPLAELLALEVGDVIPLGVECRAPLEIWAEDRPFAFALLGASAGRLALKLHSAERPADPE